MGNPKRTDQIIKPLKTYQKIGSIKRTARRYKVSNNTVCDYLNMAIAYNEGLAVVLDLSAKQLRQLLYPDKIQIIKTKNFAK